VCATAGYASIITDQRLAAPPRNGDEPITQTPSRYPGNHFPDAPVVPQE